MEASPKIPASILRQSRIIMNEPTPGLKANLLGLLRGIPESRHSLPAETARVQFLLCWLQAVITQRLRFAPLSFTQIYEFNDSDFSAGLKRISAWVEHVAKGRSNVDPASIPWLAIRTSLSQYAFGGRVDVEQDQAVLESFIDHLFQPKAYDVDFPLVTSEQSLHIPDCTNIAGFIDWTSTLPEQDSPSLLGLQPKAATVIATQQGKSSGNLAQPSSHTCLPSQQMHCLPLWKCCERFLRKKMRQLAAVQKHHVPRTCNQPG